MKATALVPVEEYLRTTYRPDCDYVDGEVLERNVGEKDHSDCRVSWFTTFERDDGNGKSMLTPSREFKSPRAGFAFRTSACTLEPLQGSRSSWLLPSFALKSCLLNAAWNGCRTALTITSPSLCRTSASSIRARGAFGCIHRTESEKSRTESCAPRIRASRSRSPKYSPD